MAKRHKLAVASALIGLYHLLTRRPRPAGDLTPTTCVRSIVVYSTTALGDLMFNTPAIYQLRRHYPAARIILVVHQKYVDLVRDAEDIDAVLSWDGSFARMSAFLRALRGHRPELAVILHSRAPYDVMSAVLAGCRFILRDDLVLDGRVPLVRWLAGWSEPGYDGHVIQRKLDMLAPLGCRTDVVSMRVPCSVDRLRFAVPGRVRIGFQLGASTAERCWPVARYAELASLLLPGQPDREIVLMGLPKEQGLADGFFAALPEALRPQVVNLVGQTSVRDAFDLVASLNVLVTGDTGPLHLAIALKVPTVSLFVTAEPWLTGPYQDPDLHDVVYRPLPADAEEGERANPMNQITVAAVAELVLARQRRIVSIQQ
jgi:ADP-heptose:LPS heptosyltransferase